MPGKSLWPGRDFRTLIGPKRGGRKGATRGCHPWGLWSSRKSILSAKVRSPQSAARRGLYFPLSKSSLPDASEPCNWFMRRKAWLLPSVQGLNNVVRQHGFSLKRLGRVQSGLSCPMPNILLIAIDLPRPRQRSTSFVPFNNVAAQAIPNGRQVFQFGSPSGMIFAFSMSKARHFVFFIFIILVGAVLPLTD